MSCHRPLPGEAQSQAHIPAAAGQYFDFPDIPRRPQGCPHKIGDPNQRKEGRGYAEESDIERTHLKVEEVSPTRVPPRTRYRLSKLSNAMRSSDGTRCKCEDGPQLSDGSQQAAAARCRATRAYFAGKAERWTAAPLGPSSQLKRLVLSRDEVDNQGQSEEEGEQCHQGLAGIEELP